jgi:hypothetical protein
MSMIDEIEKYASAKLDPSELAKLESQFGHKIPSLTEFEQYEDSFKQSPEGIVLGQHICKLARAYKKEMIRNLEAAPDVAVFQTMLKNQDATEELMAMANELAKYYAYKFHKYLEGRGFPGK